jgi:hypothetical protein
MMTRRPAGKGEMETWYLIGRSGSAGGQVADVVAESKRAADTVGAAKVV